MSSTPTPPGLSGREIFIEFVELGNAVRVAAIDAATGEEVVIQAGKHSPRSEMERVVLAKLARKLGLNKNEKRPGDEPGRGIKV